MVDAVVTRGGPGAVRVRRVIRVVFRLVVCSGLCK